MRAVGAGGGASVGGRYTRWHAATARVLRDRLPGVGARNVRLVAAAVFAAAAVARAGCFAALVFWLLVGARPAVVVLVVLAFGGLEAGFTGREEKWMRAAVDFFGDEDG